MMIMSNWPGFSWMHRRQVVLYLVAMLGGTFVGIIAPEVSTTLEQLINPFLGLLLYATFLSLPLTKLRSAVRNLKFLSALTLLNFVVVPAVVFALTRFIDHQQALFYAVLLVLLAPCVDYVIIFSGIAGGDSARLLAATPLLLLFQVLLIPLYMYIFAGPEVSALFNTAPFVHALLGLIILPFVAALVTQLLMKKFAFAQRINSAAEDLMVPLMIGTLFSVVASQIYEVSSQFQSLATAILIFAIFLVLMIVLSIAVGKMFRLDIGAWRALTFSGVTRNSLVVLPVALAFPAQYSLASSVVVSQTLVELVGMLIMIQLIPKIIRDKQPTHQ